MPVLRALALALALLTLTLVPTAAQAQVPGESATKATLEVGQFDRQLTHVPLKLTCTTASPGASACQVAVRAKWSMIDADSGQHQTEPAQFATLPWSVPQGTTGSLDVDTTKLGLKDKAVASNGKLQALVDIDVVDGAGAGVDFGSAVGNVPPFHSTCHQPRSFSFTGGPVKQLSFDGKTFDPVVSDQLDSNVPVTVGAKPASFSLYGVTYEFAVKSEFILTCSSLTDYAKGKAFPTVFMHKGSVHVTGKPRSFQYVSTIFTKEGSLGSRSQEKVDFVVKRDGKTRKSTLKVKTGHTTQITPVNSSTRSPCTSGHALQVDRKGRITKL